MILTSILSFFGCKEKNESNKEKIEMDLLIEKSIDEYNNRKIYANLTEEILTTIPDYNLEQTILDNIDTHFEKGEQYTLDKISKLTNGQQAVFSTFWLEAEVYNGGFNQYYFNSSGKFSEIAEKGFKTIGGEKLSEIIALANKIHLKNKAKLEEYDDGTIQSFSDSYEDNPLNDLDTEFIKNLESTKFRDLRIKYIRENMNEFTTE
tara:strand:+ start:3941 stop:4558 length:618 start_codon:yes stop_codon:yes gene_type:complete